MQIFIEGLLIYCRLIGAAPVAHELIDALWNRLKIPVKTGYGMTELTVVTLLQVGYKPKFPVCS